MREEMLFFDVAPKIVASNSRVDIQISVLDQQHEFYQNGTYEVKIFPIDRNYESGAFEENVSSTIDSVRGSLTVSAYFHGEQEHKIQLIDLKSKKKYEFYVYSLKSDLFGRKPYKGDLHMHSTRSDGKESPGFIAASCRTMGYDFMAITDHYRYTPSIEAQKSFDNVEVDLLITRGEEVHPHENVHIINFGGNISVNDYIQDNKDLFEAEVKLIEEGLTSFDDPVTKRIISTNQWCFEKIRASNGLSLFCHPYWMHNEGYYISEAIITFLYDNPLFDASEVIGGYPLNDYDANALQVARYQEERAKGRTVPIVGVSDAHGCEDGQLFGWYYTVVFAPTAEQFDLIQSIKDLYSVAVDGPGNERRIPVGPYRLVKYTLFLLREVFPLHDRLCQEEGLLMHKHLQGNKLASDSLAQLKGQVESLYQHLWAYH